MQDLLYEWKTLQEVGEIGEEDLTILLYEMTCRYVQKVGDIEKVTLSRNKVEGNVAMQNRVDYEKWFVAECVPEQR